MLQFHKNTGILLEPKARHITIDNCEYEMQFLNAKNQRGSCSPNATIYKLRALADNKPNQIIKICKYSNQGNRNRSTKLRKRRFENEINALLKAKNNKRNRDIVEIIFEGTVNAKNIHNDSEIN